MALLATKVEKIASLVAAGQTEAALKQLRHVLTYQADAHDWRQLWVLRKKVGARFLIDAGMHEAIIGRLWESLTDDTLRSSDGFQLEWVGAQLRAFGIETHSSRWPARPWQLGAAAPLLSERSRAPIRDWLLGHIERLVTLEPTELALRDSLVAGTQGLLARSGRTVEHAHWVQEPRPSDIFYALSENVPLPQAFTVFGRWVAQTAPAEATPLMTGLDAFLMVEEVRTRLPAEHADRAAAVRAAVFRASPLRALEVVVVEMNEAGQFGTLARHQVAAPASKTTAAMTWVEGSFDEAMAAVPSQHFEHAVRVIRSRM